MGAQTENDVTVCGADCCGGPPVNFENTDYATEAAVTNPTSKCCEESSADGDRCCGSPPERTASTIPESHDKVAESACQDGCCSSKESVDNLGLAIDPHLLRSEQREQSAEVVRRDKCCPKKIIAIEDNCKDNCCASRQENECQGKCCPKDASTDEDDQEADSRTKEHNTSENDCKNNCCFDAHRLLEIDTKGTACNDRMDDPRKQNDTPDCCQGKQKPCCDGEKWSLSIL